MIDHCVSAFLQRRKEKVYRTYLTDALKVIAENTAGGNQRQTMTKRWIDLVEPPKVKETRSAKEIIGRFKKRFE